MANSSLSRSDMLRLFDLLNTELAAEGAQGELYLVGGAVMCLALDARHSTRDVDSYFLRFQGRSRSVPASGVQGPAVRVGDRAGSGEALLEIEVTAI
jgi:hypothetical protein